MDASERLLQLVRALRDEMQPGAAALPVRLDSRLDRDLGFDSLAKSELLLRIEAEFALRLPAELLSTAEMPRDFLAALGATAIENAVPPALTIEGATVVGTTGAGRPAPVELATLSAVLQWHAAHQPERTHLIYLDEGDRAQPLTYGQLWREARAVAAALQQREIAPGDAVALMLPTCPAFFPCYCGILLAGGVPVPIYPPARPSQLEDHLRRHATILANAEARLLVTSGEIALPAGLLKRQVESLRNVVLANELLACDGEPLPVPARADDLALLQYTSGSTGNPKGVMLTHAQLLANIHAMAEAAGIGAEDVFVSWLPLYHDMGLICAWLSSLVHAVPFVVMSPLAFLARPERWLRAIDKYRGTLSGAPNFAYELCLKRIDDAALAGLDLSSWRIAFNGAEAVGPDTVVRFAARFAACGLRAEAIAPVYGMAECAVGLAATPGAGARIDRIRREPFVAGGEALPADVETPDAEAMCFVACGKPLPGYEIRIVDAAGAELPERHEGRLQFRGPSATAGYYRNPAATAQLIRDGWLDSGDYAYLASGEVYLTGRAKDIIIKGGRNIYPQEVEAAVGALPGIRKGCVAVFGSPDPASGTERLVIAAETRETNATALAALQQQVQDAVVELLEMPADEVVLSNGPHRAEDLEWQGAPCREPGAVRERHGGRGGRHRAAGGVAAGGATGTRRCAAAAAAYGAGAGRVAARRLVRRAVLRLHRSGLARRRRCANPCLCVELRRVCRAAVAAAVRYPPCGARAGTPAGARFLRAGGQPRQLSRRPRAGGGAALAKLALRRQTRAARQLFRARLPRTAWLRLRRALRFPAQRRRCRAAARQRRRRPQPGVLPRGHVLAGAGAGAIPHGRLPGRGT